VVAKVDQLRREPHRERDERDAGQAQQHAPRRSAQPWRAVEVRLPAVRTVLELRGPLAPAEGTGARQFGVAVLGECLAHLLARALTRGFPWIRSRRQTG